ncbi:MAG: serine/threonine-protein kinase [Verrucomicrobiales bacterium]|nr:serine/threonine-protein kinase [Verrucomicrobiales bacterium]
MTRYEIGERIGRGGICAVFRAFDNHLQREVAVKRLLPLEKTLLEEPDEGILSREVLVLARLQHPNVVTVYEFDEDENGPFAVLELIEGESLRKVIDDGALSYSDFVEIAGQIIDPLISAMELNLLHRDIKPENIMLSQLRSGRIQVKILDFGLAKITCKPRVQTVDLSGSFLGSVSYAAPEQFEHGLLDQRTDLYSLGCVFYYALTQNSPFKGRNCAETMNNHLSHRVKPLQTFRPDLPRSICDFVMMLIERDPADRPEDALEAYGLLRRAVALSKTPNGRLKRTRSPQSNGSKQAHHTLIATQDQTPAEESRHEEAATMVAAAGY